MAIQDILLPLVGEPSTAAVAAIDKCTAMARNIGARVTAAASVEILVRPKVMISADLDNTAEAARVRSVSDAEALLKAVEVASARLGVPVEQRLYRLAAADITANLARIAQPPCASHPRSAQLRIQIAQPDSAQRASRGAALP